MIQICTGSGYLTLEDDAGEFFAVACPGCDCCVENPSEFDGDDPDEFDGDDPDEFEDEDPEFYSNGLPCFFCVF